MRKLTSNNVRLLIKQRLGGEAIEFRRVHEHNVAEGLSETHEGRIRRSTDCPATSTLPSACNHVAGSRTTELQQHYWQALMKGMQHCTGSGLQGPENCVIRLRAFIDRDVSALRGRTSIMNESDASSHWRSSRLRRRYQSSNQVYCTV